VAHKTYQNLIGGRWIPSRSGKTFLNINPARQDDIVGEFQASGALDIDAAVKAAETGCPVSKLFKAEISVNARLTS